MRGTGQGDATLQAGSSTEANTRDSLETITPAGLRDVVSSGFYLSPFVVSSSTGAVCLLPFFFLQRALSTRQSAAGPA